MGIPESWGKIDTVEEKNKYKKQMRRWPEIIAEDEGRRGL